VGVVTDVTNSKVYTIEGNTSGASSLVTNGGGVKKKSYSLSSTYIDGYGSVDYSVVDGLDFKAPEVVAMKLGDRLLKNGSEGDDVKELQAALIALGFSCGSYGADGEYGDCTEMAVRAFQAAHGCEVDGEYGPETHKALKAALDAVPASADPTTAKYVQIEKGKKCYIRTGPGTENKALGVAHSLDKLQYAGETAENGWHRVKYGNGLAWVSGKYGKLVD
jgi:peptidoglycan hydrolase-like protein with peptidoglycan-binding domain